MVRMDPDAHHRSSKRGLVLAGRTGETVLFEHPLATTLPALLADDPDRAELVSRLGPPLDPRLIEDLTELGILVEGLPSTSAVTAQTKTAGRWSISRSGLMVSGIATPARWLDRWVVPVVASRAGLVGCGIVVVAGLAALLIGRPDLDAVSSNPALEVALMIVLGMAATVGHELAHAVAMVHYGRTPARAGFGFYWGAVSFFVDSTPAMTLPRRQRVVQALAGLAVDVVVLAVFAVAAHIVPSTLLAIVFWRLAVLGVVDVIVNLAPVLQVDGHWALADLLDEPDLAPRSRRALGAALRRDLPRDQAWLAVYGAVSLIAGLSLITLLVSVFWTASSDLIVSLFTGNVLEVALGVYFVGPLTIGIVFSTIGLILETVMGTEATPDSALAVADNAADRSDS